MQCFSAQIDAFLFVKHSTWNMPKVATVLASAANYMICDDHEFVDNLGERAFSFSLVRAC